MKAIVQQGYGAPADVLKLTEVDTPAVGDQEVLVSVRASSANPWDWHFIRGEPVLMQPPGIGGIRKPKFLIPGGDLAGTVVHARGTLIESYGDGNRWFGPIGNIIKAAVVSPFVGQTLKSFTARESTESLDEITDLIETGRLSPVIDRTYPLAEAAQAVELVEQGRPAGKVTITVISDP